MDLYDFIKPDTIRPILHEPSPPPPPPPEPAIQPQLAKPSEEAVEETKDDKKVAELEAVIAKLTADKETLLSKLEASQKQVKELNDLVATLQAETITLKEQLKEDSSKLNATTKLTEELEAIVKALTADKNSLTSELEMSHKQRGDLQSLINSLKAQNDALKSQLSDQEREYSLKIDTFLKQIESLLKDSNSMLQTNKKLSTTIEELTRSNSDIQRAYAELKRQFDAYKHDADYDLRSKLITIDTLKSEISTLKNNLSYKDQQLDRLRDENSQYRLNLMTAESNLRLFKDKVHFSLMLAVAIVILLTLLVFANKKVKLPEPQTPTLVKTVDNVSDNSSDNASILEQKPKTLPAATPDNTSKATSQAPVKWSNFSIANKGIVVVGKVNQPHYILTITAPNISADFRSKPTVTLIYPDNTTEPANVLTTQVIKQTKSTISLQCQILPDTKTPSAISIGPLNRQNLKVTIVVN